MGDSQPSPRSRAKSQTEATARLAVQEKVSDWMDSMNPYALTLVDPVTYTGVRIPNQTVSKSATFVIQDFQMVTTNANGYAMVAYGVGTSAADYGSLLPRPGNYNFGTYSGDAALDPSSIFFGGTNFQTGGWVAGGAIPQTYDAVRLVSAQVSFEYQGTVGSADGRMSAVFVPKNFFDVRRGGSSVTLQKLESYPGSVSVDLATTEPVTLKYRPIDEEVLAYAPSPATISAQSVQGMFFPGCFICFVSGAASGARIKATFHGNYEALPKEMSGGSVRTAPSISDELALAGGLNRAAREPNAVVGLGATIPQEPEPVPEDGEKSAALAGRHIRRVNLRTGVKCPGSSAMFESSQTSGPLQSRPLIEMVLEGLPFLKKKGSAFASQMAPLLASLGPSARRSTGGQE